MLNALIRLTLIITIPLLLLIYTQSYNPIYLIRAEINKQFYVDSYRGTFYLINEKFKQNSTDKWPKQFHSLSKKFGLPLKLINTNSLNKEQVTQLNEQEFIYLEGEPTVLRQKIANSDWVIELNMDESRQNKITQQTQGTVYLLEKYFSEIPQQNWPTSVDNLAKNFGMPLSLTQLNKLNLSPVQLDKITVQGGTAIQVTDEGDTVHHRLTNSDWVLSAGPISQGQANFYMILGVMLAFILVIVLALLSWLVPLWRDLKALDIQALNFGEGRLDSRIQFKGGSIMARLGSSFNVMANNIQKLIHSNQQLTNAVAHDLRTPLARLKFALEILEDEECSEDEKQRYQKSIHASINSLDCLINQTLIHARYSRAADIKNFSRSNIATALTDEFEQHSRDQAEIKFSLTVDETLADNEQLADPRALIRALSNLLSNALRFAKSKINVTFKCDDKNYYLIVEDDGPGINEAHIESIFQPFSQINNEERSTGQGHGLGLAIVYQIALWHKGQASVERSSLGGARFELCWPVEK